MSFVATAIAASSIVGAGASIYGANKQANAAGDAAGAANAQNKQNRADLAPWRNTGVAANSKLAEMLGISPTTGPDWNAYLKNNPDVAASATYGSNPAQHYEDYGRKEGRALTQLNAGTARPADFGSLLKTFSPGDLTQDPGYQFGLTEGEKGLNRSAAARGMYFSPATSKELSTFNQDYAGTKFNDAFSRDQATKSQLYGFLSGTSGAGESAAGQTANLGAQNAATVGNLTTSGAAATAAGGVGVANAATSGVGSYLNYSNQSRLLDLLNSSRAPTTNYNPSAM